jgi:hypothetical protein
METIEYFETFPGGVIDQLVLWGYKVSIESMGPGVEAHYRVRIAGRNSREAMKMAKEEGGLAARSTLEKMGLPKAWGRS